jgi:hypothetical protein
MDNAVNVTMDITGMYFSYTVSADPNWSVLRIMEQVATATKGTDHEFAFVPRANTSGRTFVEEISVYHKKPAISRQKPRPGETPRQSKPGLYLWNDRINPAQSESIPQLIWQYYVTDASGKSKSGKFGGTRIVVPFSESNTAGDWPCVFEDGDVITWRMVGIFVRTPDTTDPESTVKFTVSPFRV